MTAAQDVAAARRKDIEAAPDLIADLLRRAVADNVLRIYAPDEGKPAPKLPLEGDLIVPRHIRGNRVPQIHTDLDQVFEHGPATPAAMKPYFEPVLLRHREDAPELGLVKLPPDSASIPFSTASQAAAQSGP